MFKRILAFFEKEGWSYHIPEDDKTIAMFGIGTDSGKFHCILDVSEEEGRFIFFSICPVNVPEKLRNNAAELINGLNYDLYFGNFEMSYEDGEIRFRTSMPFINSEISDEVIEFAISANIYTSDYNFDLINEFITEKIDLRAAMEKIKLNQEKNRD